MIWLLAVLFASIVYCGARAALRPEGVEINHVVLFSFGLLFYWVLPVAAGATRIFADQAGIAIWYGTWDAAAQSGRLAWFLVFAIVAYGAFIAGDRLGARLRTRAAAPAVELVRDPRLLRLFLLPIVAITLAYAWLLRTQLFSGYRFDPAPERAMRGTLSACSLVLLALLLLRIAESKRWPRRTGWPGLVLDPFFLAYCFTAILVLSTGGRLYVASAATTALVFHTVYHRALPLHRTIVIGSLALLLVGAAGTLRMGYAPTPLGVLVNVVSEPLFTSFSLLHFVAQGEAPWISFPRFLLGDFLNLVPSAVFPSKTQYLMRPEDFGYSIFSPLGALNSYVSLTINFGLLGTPVVLFLLGAALAVLRRRRSALARVSYSMLAGWLAFTFFRDPFSISVVKNMFEFSILVPALIVAAAHVMTVIAPRRPTAVPALRSVVVPGVPHR